MEWRSLFWWRLARAELDTARRFPLHRLVFLARVCEFRAKAKAERAQPGSTYIYGD